MSNTNIKFMIRTDSISMVLPGDDSPRMILSDNPKFSEIATALKKDDIQMVIKLINPLNEFCEKQNGRLIIKDGQLVFDGEILHDVINTKINEMINRNEDPEKFLRFMENLKLNPNKRSLDELYSFIKTNSLPITSDGYLLAYKTVRRDFLDHHSCSISYKPGNIVSMPREKVCDDPETTCAEGLHVCSIGYIKNGFFGGDNKSRLILTKVHPKDVVCVPYDYGDSKVRCCELSVIAEFNVFTGKDLAIIDKAVKDNLSKLESKIKLSEDEFRSLIGVNAPKDNLDSFGKFGEVVIFNHKGRPREGHLIKGILPSENPNDKINEAIDDIHYKLINFDDINISLELKKLRKIRSESNVSLNERAIILSVNKISVDSNKDHDYEYFELLLDAIEKDPKIFENKDIELTGRLYVVEADNIKKYSIP